MRLLIVSLLFCLLSGCGHKEEQKKALRSKSAANYLLIVFSTESNFSLIGKILEGWQTYGVDYPNQLKLEKTNFSGIEDFMQQMREFKEADIELYMAVVDLYDIAVKVDSLKTSQGGYSLRTYGERALSLKQDWDVKKNKVELLMKK